MGTLHGVLEGREKGLGRIKPYSPPSSSLSLLEKRREEERRGEERREEEKRGEERREEKASIKLVFFLVLGD